MEKFKYILGIVLSCLYGVLAYFLVSESVWIFLRFVLRMGSAGHNAGLLAISLLAGLLVAAYSVYALTKKKEQANKWFIPSSKKSRIIVFSSIILVFVVILAVEAILMMGL